MDTPLGVKHQILGGKSMSKRSRSNYAGEFKKKL